MRYWIKQLDDIDKDCVLKYEYLLGRKLSGYKEYSEIDNQVDEMVFEFDGRKDFFKYYPNLKSYREDKEKIWICVYRDTIEKHNKDCNLSEILVSMDFANQYYEEVIKPSFKENNMTENDIEWKNASEFWKAYHTADDTEDFYEYADKHKAIIKIKHWQ